MFNKISHYNLLHLQVKMEKIPCDHNRAEKQNNIPPDIASDTIQNKNRKKSQKSRSCDIKACNKKACNLSYT